MNENGFVDVSFRNLSLSWIITCVSQLKEAKETTNFIDFTNLEEHFMHIDSETTKLKSRVLHFPVYEVPKSKISIKNLKIIMKINLLWKFTCNWVKMINSIFNPDAKFIFEVDNFQGSN